MLSLKKAASTENGWSISEMTTVRRLDESISMDTVDDDPMPSSSDAAAEAQARNGARMQEVVAPEVSTGGHEGIMMVSAKSSGEPR